MHHGLDACFCSSARCRDVRDVASDELRAAHRVGVPGRQVVEHGDLGAGVGEQLDHVRADVAGAARHQDLHRALDCR